MSKQIYLVTYGEYSDYGVQGYFETRDDALKYCAIKNSTDRYEDYRVEECDHLSFEVDDSVQFHKEYVFGIGINGKLNNSFSYDSYVGEKKAPYFDFEDNRYLHITETDYDRARKIAQDVVAEELAKRAGL